MNTPIEPRDDEPIEEELRPHLWRLRARLVTPPDEDRVAADLDRLHRSARAHAHGAPSTGEVVALPGVRDDGLAWTRFGQVAAALLLVVAVGGGLAVGSTSRPDSVSADGTPEPSGSVLEPGEASGEDSSDPGSVPGSVPGTADASDDLDGDVEVDVEVGRTPQDDADSAGADDGASGDGASGDGASGSDAASSGGGAAGSGAGGSGTPTGPAGPAQDGTDSGSGTDPAPADDADPPPAGDDSGPDDSGTDGSGSQDQPTEPPAGEEIIAAPDPGELDGFGGERPCPDGSVSDDCLAADEAPDDGAAADDEARPEPEQPESPSEPTTPTAE